MKINYPARLLSDVGCLVVLLACLPVFAASAASTTLIPTNSIWRYLADGSNQGVAWRAPGFDDSGWATGAAPLGYGLTGIATTQATGRVTYYHRRTFNVSAPGAYSNLIVRLRRDDGGIVYINDTEVFRSNMPTGAVDFATLATISATGTSQFTFFSNQVPTSVLVPGLNHIAVEIHQAGTNSVDAAFNLELTAASVAAPDAEPPIIVSLNSVTNNRIGLCFNEPVALPSATNHLNYTVDAGLVGVTNVVLRPDGRAVELFLSSPIDEFYSVAVTDVLDLAGNPAADVKTGCTSRYSSGSVGTPSDPDPAGSVFSCFWDSFEVTVGGSGIGGTNDSFHFIDQTVSGDFDARVRVTRLDFAGPFSQAGLMARETLAGDSRTVQTYFTPVAGANQIETTVRAIPGGATTDTEFHLDPRAPADPVRWLRITRSNDVFTTYHGTNGSDWVFSGMTTQAFSASLYVGLMTSSHTNGVATTASFIDFLVSEAQPVDGIIPTLITSIVGTNMVVEWARTKRAFALEVTSDLGVSSEWGILVAPYQLDGNVWRLSIPVGSLGNQLFIRATRVERLIPNVSAIMVKAGILLSPDNGLSGGGATGTLCTNASVIPNTAYAQTGAHVVFSNPTSPTAWVDTLQSSYGMNTVLQVRNKTTGGTLCNDDASTSETRSKKELPAPTVGTKFTFITGAKTGTTLTSVIQVWLNY